MLWSQNKLVYYWCEFVPWIAVWRLPWLAEVPARTSPDCSRQLQGDNDFPEKGSREAPRRVEPRWPSRLYWCLPGRDGEGKIIPWKHGSVYNVIKKQCFLLICQKKEDPQAGFNIETLLVCLLDLIEAGTETSSTTLRWGLVYMMHYPEIQG